MTSKPLRVMVVHDDILVAQRLAREIWACGQIVVGPFSDLHEAMRAVGTVQAAILDVNIQGESTLCMADWLMHSDVPFVFLTSQDRSAIPARFDGHRSYPKLRPAAPLLDDLRRQHRTLSAQQDDDPRAVVVAMMERSRTIMPDASSAERLVEAVLLRAVSQSVETGVPAQFRHWLMALMDHEIGQRRRHLQ